MEGRSFEYLISLQNKQNPAGGGWIQVGLLE